YQKTVLVTGELGWIAARQTRVQCSKKTVAVGGELFDAARVASVVTTRKVRTLTARACAQFAIECAGVRRGSIEYRAIGSAVDSDVGMTRVQNFWRLGPCVLGASVGRTGVGRVNDGRARV